MSSAESSMNIRKAYKKSKNFIRSNDLYALTKIWRQRTYTVWRIKQSQNLYAKRILPAFRALDNQKGLGN